MIPPIIPIISEENDSSIPCQITLFYANEILLQEKDKRCPFGLIEKIHFNMINFYMLTCLIILYIERL